MHGGGCGERRSKEGRGGGRMRQAGPSRLQLAVIEVWKNALGTNTQDSLSCCYPEWKVCPPFLAEGGGGGRRQ